jgi:murein DD-endopeptidase MepM/ murein hydrolase activator NlpD
LLGSGTHNGVDFKASVGTPVKAVLGGIVKGTGNTDDQAGCYSYGRWVLIEHPNGLSSLYAHLSQSRVSQGQSISTGEVLGYSGGQPGVFGSGYSTGPHLHLGLYASQGVEVKQYTQSLFCKKVFIPVASANAYLDPLAYLPALP